MERRGGHADRRCRRADPDVGRARLSAVRPEPDPDGSARPSAEDLRRILATATTVPDHGDLRPWRFAVCTGAGRDRFAEALVAGLTEARGPDVPEAVVAKMRGKAYAAPCSVQLIASPDPTSNVEVWEQVASASCTGYAVVLAATGLGYGAVWKSAAVLGTGAGAARCSTWRPTESLLGWINIGTPGAARPQEARRGRRRPRWPGGCSPSTTDRRPSRHQPKRASGGPMPASSAQPPAQVHAAGTGSVGGGHPAPAVAAGLLEAGRLRPPGRRAGAAPPAGAVVDTLVVVEVLEGEVVGVVVHGGRSAARIPGPGPAASAARAGRSAARWREREPRRRRAAPAERQRGGRCPT